MFQAIALTAAIADERTYKLISSLIWKRKGKIDAN
jgi:hypothetical protein